MLALPQANQLESANPCLSATKTTRLLRFSTENDYINAVCSTYRFRLSRVQYANWRNIEVCIENSFVLYKT